VVAAGPADYERFVLETLTKVPGIEKVKTTFVLSSSKVTTKIPVKGLDPQPPKMRPRRRKTLQQQPKTLQQEKESGHPPTRPTRKVFL